MSEVEGLPFLLSAYQPRLVWLADKSAAIERLYVSAWSAIVPNKVLVVASGGGHWIQMRRLQPAFDGLDVAFVSVRSAYAEEVSGHRFYAVRDVTRWDRVGLAILVAQLTYILIRERPHVVVTTGSAPGMIALALARCLLRSRTMWIDSIANCEQMSMSGKRARRFCDVWLTQWPHLSRVDGPDCWGAVL